MKDRVYDILNKIQRWLPALGVFYLAISAIWGLPYGDQINATIVAVAALLATTLEVATGQYMKMKQKEFEDTLYIDDDDVK